MFKKSFILIAIFAVAFSQPGPPHDGEYVAGGIGADLTNFDLHNHSKQVGNGSEFNNTSWIAPARDGMLLSNIMQGIVSYVDFRGGHRLHTLVNLTRPAMVGENSKGDWYVACLGHHDNTSTHVGSGIAIGVQRANYTVYEHAVPASFIPNTTSPYPRQAYSRLEAVNEHAFKDDYVIALDTGFDHVYHWGLAEWKAGLQVIHTFERGFGPHSMAFSRQGFMNVLGEYDPAFAVLAWNNKTQDFTEIARHQIIAADKGWTGGDILVNREGHVFVSVRHAYNESGYLAKYEYVPGAKGEKEFKELAKAEVGYFPTRISMSQDEARIIVCNSGGSSVEVLSSHDLKKMGGFFTPKMNPLFAHEIRHNGRSFEDFEETAQETIEEELLVEEMEEIIAEEIVIKARFLSS